MKFESCKYEWLELRPRDLIFEGTHFVLILENIEQEVVMPVRFSMQSAELLGAANVESLWKTSLRTMIDELFVDWQVEWTRCTFMEHRLGHHKVRLFYTKEGKTAYIEKDLAALLGLCLESDVPFFATKEYIREVRDSQNGNEIFLLNQQWTDDRQKYLM